MVHGASALTERQTVSLAAGFELGSGRGFATAEEYGAAWWAHREELLYVCGPFRRPEAFWWLEHEQAPPDCPAGGYESERDALIRVGAQLSPHEQTLLRSQGGSEVDSEFCTRVQNDSEDDPE